MTRSIRVYGTNGTVTVSRATSFVYPTDGSTSALAVAVNESGLNKQENWSVSFGRTNRSYTTWLDSTNRLEISVGPDGSWSQSSYAEGRLLATTNYASDSSVLASTRIFYDSTGRQLYTLDIHDRISSNTYNEAGQVVATTIYAPGMPPRITSYTFDDMGRVIATDLPDGGAVTNEYYLTGELHKTYGARTYPVEYAYDNQGRMTNMITWQDFAGSNGAAATCWIYDSQRGFMTAKVYADNATNSYAYTPGGKLSKRTWVRKDSLGQPLITEYGYTKGGDLESVWYSDDTPDVRNQYNRLGQTTRVFDGTGQRHITFDSRGLATNDHYETSIYFVGMGVQREYDSLGRLSHLATIPVGGGSVTNEVAYTYDPASRIKTVCFGSNTVTYSYATNSSLVESILFNNGISNILLTSKQYDVYDRLTNIASTVAGQGLAGYTYGYNLADQRTNCVMNDGSAWQYTYDVLGQLTNGNRSWSDGQPVDGQQYTYTYDDIGNRTEVGRGVSAAPSYYTANLLNQYTQRTVPGEAWIQGEANTNANVQVNDQAADRHNVFFSKKLTLTNTTSAVYASVTVQGIASNGATTVTNTYTGHTFVPVTPEAFTYDPDGNMTSDGRWTNIWDAENRLIRMETLTNMVGTSVPPVRLIFTYDSQSRRIRKQVFSWPQGATNWTSAADHWYIYDGWNLVHEERRPDFLTRRVNIDYVWGIDLSGSMQGAGGIGGLLAIQSSLGFPCSTGAPSPVVYSCFDANGNLTDLVSSNGLAAAHYEYDPYGNTLSATGPAAKINPFRFSTKYTDDETGLVYYGHRSYWPVLGRWGSRDPMGEAGVRQLIGRRIKTNRDGNLYHHLRNQPTWRVDPLGLEAKTPKQWCKQVADDWQSKALFPEPATGFKKWWNDYATNTLAKTKVKFFCECCAPKDNKDGSFEWGWIAKRCNITLCYDNIKKHNTPCTGENFYETAVHELTHCAQYVSGNKPASWNCKKCLCGEIQAYHREDPSTADADLISAAKGSCIGSGACASEAAANTEVPAIAGSLSNCKNNGSM